MSTTVSAIQKEPVSIKHNKVNLFVYGTLKEGFRAHRLLQPCNVVARNARVLGKMYTQEDEHFPMVMPCDDGERDFVMGDVYEIEAWMVERVDRYEGHPYLFKRTPVDKILASTGDWVKMENTFMYMYNPADKAVSKTHFVHIPSGIWQKI